MSLRVRSALRVRLFSRAIIAAVTATLIATVAVVTLTGASEPKMPTDGLAYVALGDSFAAGLGLADPTKLPVTGCGQTATDYPHRVAQALRLTLSDVTCSGAVTANVISTPQKTGDGTAKPQLSALGRNTRVVTITIGGNDLGFVKTTASCVALTARGPLLASANDDCRGNFVKNGVDSLGDRIAGPVVHGMAPTEDAGTATPSGLTATFAAISKAAPNARVFVVGYPTIMPNAANTPAAGCFRGQIEGNSLSNLRLKNSFPFTNIDVEYLNSVERALDTATARAAERAGFTFISALAGSAAHSGCAATSSYVNGITLEATRTYSVSLSGGALHPNADGAAFVASSIVPIVKQAFAVKVRVSQPPAGSGAVSVVAVWVSVAVLIILLGIAVAVLLVVRRRDSRSH